MSYLLFDFIQTYGEEATAWLKEMGVTANGFNPATTLEKTGEEIFVNSLQVKIDKLTLMTSEKDFLKVLEKFQNHLSRTTLSSRQSIPRGMGSIQQIIS